MTWRCWLGHHYSPWTRIGEQPVMLYDQQIALAVIESRLCLCCDRTQERERLVNRKHVSLEIEITATATPHLRVK